MKDVYIVQCLMETDLYKLLKTQVGNLYLYPNIIHSMWHMKHNENLFVRHKKQHFCMKKLRGKLCSEIRKIWRFHPSFNFSKEIKIKRGKTSQLIKLQNTRHDLILFEKQIYKEIWKDVFFVYSDEDKANLCRALQRVKNKKMVHWFVKFLSNIFYDFETLLKLFCLNLNMRNPFWFFIGRENSLEGNFLFGVFEVKKYIGRKRQGRLHWRGFIK